MKVILANLEVIQYNLVQGKSVLHRILFHHELSCHVTWFKLIKSETLFIRIWKIIPSVRHGTKLQCPKGDTQQDECLFVLCLRLFLPIYLF